MGRYSSGQRGRTVTPLVSSFASSNLARPTKLLLIFKFKIMKTNYENFETSWNSYEWDTKGENPKPSNLDTLYSEIKDNPNSTYTTSHGDTSFSQTWKLKTENQDLKLIIIKGGGGDGSGYVPTWKNVILRVTEKPQNIFKKFLVYLLSNIKI